MKGYYIFFGSNSNGVNKKIDMQIAELNKYFDVEKVLVCQKKRSIIEKVVSCIPNVGIGYEYKETLKKLNKPDFIYLRRMTADSSYVHFFKMIKDKYPNCKILIEIPTYPYFRDSYCHNFKHFLRSFPYYLKDVIYTKKLKKAVDRIVTFAQDEKIYGINTIRTMNGIDVNSCRIVESSRSDSEINLISVAMLAPHHGYERILMGLYDYYKNNGKRNFIYHCVGYGEEYDKYKSIVENYHLKKHVVFYGKKAGAELDAIYNNMHIALDCFGLYKEHTYYYSSLKAREYLAKGLPVISGGVSDVFHKYPTDYYCEFPNNSSPIDMNLIAEFYDHVYDVNIDAAQIHDNIHNYAMKHIDYSIVMKPIIDFIKDE